MLCSAFSNEVKVYMDSSIDYRGEGGMIIKNSKNNLIFYWDWSINYFNRQSPQKGFQHMYEAHSFLFNFTSMQVLFWRDCLQKQKVTTTSLSGLTQNDIAPYKISVAQYATHVIIIIYKYDTHWYWAIPVISPITSPCVGKLTVFEWETFEFQGLNFELNPVAPIHRSWPSVLLRRLLSSWEKETIWIISSQGGGGYGSQK